MKYALIFTCSGFLFLGFVIGEFVTTYKMERSAMAASVAFINVDGKFEWRDFRTTMPKAGR